MGKNGKRSKRRQRKRKEVSVQCVTQIVMQGTPGSLRSPLLPISDSTTFLIKAIDVDPIKVNFPSE